MISSITTSILISSRFTSLGSFDPWTAGLFILITPVYSLPLLVIMVTFSCSTYDKGNPPRVVTLSLPFAFMERTISPRVSTWADIKSPFSVPGLIGTITLPFTVW